jgi:hypothetical protein
MLSACFNTDDEMAGAKKLVVTQPCLPVDNNCEILLESLDNVKLRLQFKAPPSYQRLLPVTLESTEASLENILITLLIDGDKMPAEEMKISGDKQYWEAQILPFATVTKDNLKVRLTISYKASRYFAEFPVSY